MSENILEKGTKREFGANAPSFLGQKGRRKRFFCIKPVSEKYRRAVFFLIVSVDTIRLSADILIAFENFLIVFMNSLIGRVVETEPIQRATYCKLDFKQFSAP